MIKLLHDPNNGALPTAFTASPWMARIVITDFSVPPTDRYGRGCGRCNRPVSHHLWQVVDTEQAEQDGVLDCELAAVTA